MLDSTYFHGIRGAVYFPSRAYNAWQTWSELNPEEICKKVGAQVRVVLGEFPAGAVGEMDLLIMSPGISCEMPLVEEFRKRNLPVWGELELAYRTGRGHVMAVTGTNGKTTTVTLLGEIMQDHYREVYTVGNIGIPYTDVSMRQSDEAWTVAEVSSFQLETIDTFHPQASAITNITEDHLNRHHTMEEYIRVKERIAENQTEGEICVLNYEDAVLRAFGESVGCRARVRRKTQPSDCKRCTSAEGRRQQRDRSVQKL